MDMILNVQPEVLTAKAGEILSEKTTITGFMDQAKSDIKSLTGVWKSEASDEFQSRFNQIYDDIDNMLAILAEYIHDINESANIYTTAERAAKTAAEGLPIDGVFK